MDLRKCTKAEAREILNYLAYSFNVNEYVDEAEIYNDEIIYVNDIPYLKFYWDSIDGHQLRYATIINGDMIYVWATRTDDDLSDNDKEALAQIVESIQF